MFEAVHVPYPLLLLRNSFLLINDKLNLLINSLNLSSIDLFKSEFELIESIVIQTSGNQLNMQEKEKNGYKKFIIAQMV